eukprot:TRINITY_DN1609_c0_g2_i1.p1 TRINITY_DN1609_c0_g2~~TRINITY_DN1609_c0_g2_i1.p1  ORF type:complete len:177 (-),score=30.25 TRINITY_DN1609_c0_g2_i1:57-587(-)
MKLFFLCLLFVTGWGLVHSKHAAQISPLLRVLSFTSKPSTQAPTQHNTQTPTQSTTTTTSTTTAAGTQGTTTTTVSSSTSTTATTTQAPATTTTGSSTSTTQQTTQAPSSYAYPNPSPDPVSGASTTSCYGGCAPVSYPVPQFSPAAVIPPVQQFAPAEITFVEVDAETLDEDLED